MADRFPLILNTSINQIQEIASGDQLDLTGNNIANAGIISATTFKGALDITSASFSGTINANGNLDVDGQTELDHVNISGITTFVGEIDANGKIVGAQLDNVIPFYYDNTGQFPSASTYHGAVAHAHNTGKLYFAHAGWKELVSKEANGTIGVGTEVYNIGTLTVSGGVSIGGTLTYEDVTNIDSVGIVTAREGVFIPDNKELKIGNTAASPDLKIYHDTSDSIIHQDGTGDLRIRSDNSIEINTNGTQNAIWCDAGAAVKLYYNNGLKLKTTSTGIEVGDPVANSGVLSVSGGTSSNPILASTSSDYVGKFSSTDAVARLIIQDNSGTNNGNGIQVQGDTLKLMTGDSPALTCDSSQNVTIAGNLDLGDSNITNVGTIACDSIKGDADDNTNITFATNDVITFKAGTTSPALTINTTQVKVEDSQKFIAGTGNDLEIFFDGTHSKIDHTPTSGTLFLAGDSLVLSNSGMGQYYLQAAENGAVSLNYSGSPKLATSNTGVTITGTATATAFSGPLTGNVTGEASQVSIGSGANNRIITASGANTLDCAGNFTFNGNVMTLGAAGAEGGALRINGGSINNPGGVDAKVYIDDPSSNDWALHINKPSHDYGLQLAMSATATHAFYIIGGGAEKFRIGGAGNIEKCGHIYPIGNGNHDLGASSNRWRNLYTSDLHCSNEGSKNDVDGTWGDYTIQEGESDLFLINNRSGKKYKFNLTEVS